MRSSCSRRVDDLSRRNFLKTAGCGGLMLLVPRWGVGSAMGGELDQSSVTRMDIDVVYRTRMMNFPSDAEVVDVWMPLPPQDGAQEIKNLTIDCPFPYEITTSEPYANRMVHLRTEKLEPFVLESRYTVIRRRAGAEAVPPEIATDEKYVRLTSRVRVTEDIEAFAKGVVGNATRPMDVGRKVFDAIIDTLSYDNLIAGCGTGDTTWIMKHRSGKCDDYHALFMAMMISRGIPVRWEQGFPLPYPSETGATSGSLSGDCSGAHCWASFYDPEAGWVPVDVSEADKHPELKDFLFGHLTPNRFKISEGRSIVVNPKQGGDALSTFAFAYAEADGLPLIYHANYENAVEFDITGVETA